MNGNKTRVLIWDENPPHANKALYPNSIRGAIADGLQKMNTTDRLDIKVAHLDEPDQGCPQELLDETDVLLWWGHARHAEVDDAVVERIKDRVHHGGMGLIALHSAHYSKVFKSVMNCTGHLKGGWREDNSPERIFVCASNHPIAYGLRDFTLREEEMYGAPFDVPPAETIVLQSFYPAGGEYFPSGICWTAGDGIDPDFTSGPGRGVGKGEGIARVFYFRPGHEGNPTYHNTAVRRVIYNATLWCAHQNTSNHHHENGNM
ncbi:MAG: ThuA domain-containing protein [Armatimonadota bacterium]